MSFAVWTIAPILGAGVLSFLGILTAVDTADAGGIEITALFIAGALVVFLIVKAVRDYQWGQSLQQARYDAVKELHNKLGPALDLMSELAGIDPGETLARHKILETIATHCCSALVAMTPDSAEVRAVVFELKANPDEIAPLGRFGRHDAPRTFKLSDADGAEILAYLQGAAPKGELYTDTRATAPDNYEGDRDRYRTFIRTAIWSNGVVFGMVTVDAPKQKTLSKGDVTLAELIAAELGPAFAIAAD